MSELSISYRSLADLRERSNNPRTHSRRQIEQIAASISRFGFTNPILVDDEGCLIAGHGRLAAARQLKLDRVPVIRRSDMSEAEIRAYVIADNRLAEKAGWDEALLSLEFSYLANLDEDFDLSVTGFELPEIDAFIGGAPAREPKSDRLDRVPGAASGPAVTQPGDIWQIGEHRLVCGNALTTSAYEALLAGEKASMIFSDPPYNVPINGHVSGLGKPKHAEFAMASGEMSNAEFATFLLKAFSNQASFSLAGSIHFQCIDWRHVEEMQTAGRNAYNELKNICVWVKANGGMGSLYRSAHELVFVYKSGNGPHINNVELGKHGRYRTNVWQYPGVNSFGATRDADLAMHPTVKPVAMVADAIMDCSRRKDIVLDAFAGSGTTLVAAQKTKRRGYGIEIDPGYCDTIVRRLQNLFKIEARLTTDNRTFDEIASAQIDFTGEGSLS